MQVYFIYIVALIWLVNAVFLNLFPDIQTFWTALGALGTIAAVVVALLLQRKEREDKRNEDRNNILSSLALEIFTNLEALQSAHMTEVLLSTLAYTKFKENPTLFDIHINQDLYSKLDILYKNFNYYNFRWQQGLIGSSTEEIKIRIFIYTARLFEEIENYNQIIHDLSNIIGMIKDYRKDKNNNLKMVDNFKNFKSTLNESDNYFKLSVIVKEISEIKLENLTESLAPEEQPEKLKVHIVGIVQKYIVQQYELESRIDMHEFNEIIFKF